jgi:hypothetical protein
LKQKSHPMGEGITRARVTTHHTFHEMRDTVLSDQP